MIKKILKEVLQDFINKLDAGTCDMSEEEMLKALEVLNQANSARGMSKEQAANYLHLSRSTFDLYVKNGWIPKGKKVQGFKELSWDKDLLDIARHKIQEIVNKPVID